MRESLYLDTSVVSALFDDRTPERQRVTKDFWKMSNNYERFISSLVEEEIASASSHLQKKMEDKIRDCNVLPMTENTETLAETYVEYDVVPKKYIGDALHIAVAVVNDIDYVAYIYAAYG